MLNTLAKIKNTSKTRFYNENENARNIFMLKTLTPKTTKTLGVVS